MTNSLNLYATKVFSEQPIALWALDDVTDYISVISNDNKDLSNWEVTGATVVDATNELEFTETPPAAPFSGIAVNGLVEEIGNSGLISLVSPTTLQPADINSILGSIALGSYFFTYDTSVTITFSLEYKDPTSETPLEILSIQKSQFLQATSERAWAFVSQTFGLPSSFSDMTSTPQGPV